MISLEDLSKNGIQSWELVKKEYKNPDLLLGNGFSLQFSNKFSYNSLFEIFLSNCDPTHQVLFNQFETTNFELIQKYLAYSKIVNTILKLPIEQIDTAIEQLKEGLIKTIEAVHPRSQEIDFNQLNNIALQLAEFGDIFSTNYDLYLYHILIKSNDISATSKSYTAYQDYFWGTEAPQGFKQFVHYQKFQYKHVYYLHGSLFIFREGAADIKLLKDAASNELIDKISEQIKDNRFPTFISEGSGSDKLNSIRHSNYLLFSINKLKHSGKPLVIFGNVLGEFDNHILNAIKEIPKNIVYCIYTGERTLAELNTEKYSFLSKFNDYPNQIDFVDSKTVFEL